MKDLRCPCGHRMRPDSLVLDQGGIRCTSKEPGIECGRWVYLLALHSTEVGDPHRDLPLFVAEVTLDELREMQRKRMPLSVVFEYLGTPTFG
jgi:hypothetical protein